MADLRVLELQGGRIEPFGIVASAPDARDLLREALGRPAPARPDPRAVMRELERPAEPQAAAPGGLAGMQGILPRLQAAVGEAEVAGDPVLLRCGRGVLPVDAVRVVAAVVPVWVEAPLRSEDDAVDLLVANAARIVVDGAHPDRHALLDAVGPGASVLRWSGPLEEGLDVARGHGACLLVQGEAARAALAAGDGVRTAAVGVYVHEGTHLRELAPEPAEGLPAPDAEE